MRRWLHEIGWVWKRAKLVARADEPQRVTRLARMRWVCAQRQVCAALVCADELATHLWPTVGCAWRPQGTPLEVMTPGPHRKHYLAGALALHTGTLHYCLGPRHTNALCRDLRNRLDARYPADR
jgi:hypothetical protein